MPEASNASHCKSFVCEPSKTDLIQIVSRHILYKLIDNGQRFDHYLSRDIVTQVQLTVIKAISASTLLS